MALITRRSVLTGLGFSTIICTTAGLVLSPSFRDLFLASGERLSYQTHRLISRNALAPEFTEAEMSPDFRTNGNTMPASADYQRHMETEFANWQLQVDGLVSTPKSFSLAALKAMPARTQITRHDCVEGWSAIGKWTGVPFSALLAQVTLLPAARYLVLHCADDFSGDAYYESIDLVDAFHPQTILAHTMNDSPLSVGHGAPLRLRVERQLGYKQAKYIMRIEATATLTGTGLGKGGFWEDQIGYDWYAGI
ncbi:MAG: molybdopterin-dependent oxidoreductase [Cypionkella sp.]